MGWAKAIVIFHSLKESYLDYRHARGESSDWLNAFLSPHRLLCSDPDDEFTASTRRDCHQLFSRSEDDEVK
jgi:hypothetical protein